MLWDLCTCFYNTHSPCIKSRSLHSWHSIQEVLETQAFTMSCTFALAFSISIITIFSFFIWIHRRYQFYICIWSKKRRCCVHNFLIGRAGMTQDEFLTKDNCKSALHYCCSISIARQTSLNRWMDFKKIWYIYTVKYHKAVNKNKILKCLGKWISLKKLYQLRKLSPEKRMHLFSPKCRFKPQIFVLYVWPEAQV